MGKLFAVNDYTCLYLEVANLWTLAWVELTTGSNHPGGTRESRGRPVTSRPQIEVLASGATIMITSGSSSSSGLQALIWFAFTGVYKWRHFNGVHVMDFLDDFGVGGPGTGVSLMAK